MPNWEIMFSPHPRPLPRARERGARGPHPRPLSHKERGVRLFLVRAGGLCGGMPSRREFIRWPSRRPSAMLVTGIMVLALLLAGCAGVGSQTGAGSRSGAANDKHPSHGAQPILLGKAAPGTTLALSLVLRGQSPAELQQVLAAVSDPHSPSYRQYLTPAEIASRFGASAQDKARIAGVLQAAGWPAPSYSADGLLASLRVTVGQAETFFSVRLNRYRASDGRVYIAPDAAPRIPAAFAGAVVGVLGLDGRNVLHTGALLAPHHSSVSGVNGLGPSDIERAYDLGPLHQAGLSGANQTIALAEIDMFNQADIQAYDQQYSINAPAPQVVQVGDGANSVSPEPELDIEVAQAIAPQANILVYESPKDLLSVAQMVSQIVSDDRAQVLSISLGTCEAQLDPSIANSFLTSLDNSFRRAGAEGMSVLVASGDSGAYDCQDSQLSVGAVAASPYVTSVGGTALFLHTDGTYNYEAGWEGPLKQAGGGGGLSTIYQLPSWQSGPGVQNTASDGMRQVPDVSADADPLTGYAVYYADSGCRQQCWQVVGGTSAATPLWAALVLLINQSAQQHGKHPLGFLDPALYRLGSGAGAGVTAPLPFHDVTIGGNLYYDATPGWDYSTGWGSPDGAVLARDLLNAQ